MEFEEAFWEDYNWMMLAQSDVEESSVVFENLNSIQEKPILVAFEGGENAIEDENLSDEEIVQIGKHPWIW